MKWPTEKQWKAGVRPCMKCGQLMKKGEWNKVETPPEYIGQPYDWCHKREPVCAYGYFHCPGEKCDHTKPNGFFWPCLKLAIEKGRKTLELLPYSAPRSGKGRRGQRSRAPIVLEALSGGQWQPRKGKVKTSSKRTPNTKKTV